MLEHPPPSPEPPVTSAENRIAAAVLMLGDALALHGPAGYQDQQHRLPLLDVIDVLNGSTPPPPNVADRLARR